jgi:hypothetical protein
MTQELELDCLDQLEATPATLRGLMCDLSGGLAGPPLRFCKGGGSCTQRLDFPPVTAELIVPTLTKNVNVGPRPNPNAPNG